ncbi:MAG: PAS domain S-box protein [Pseudomonadota bacterium]
MALQHGEISEPGKSGSGLGSTFWTLVVFSLVSGVAVIFMFAAHVDKVSERLAVQHARDMSRALNVFRASYAKQVVGRLGDGANITATHEYRSKANAIPLPATFSIELANALTEHGDDTTYRLLSAKPFPWRADRQLSSVEREAIDYLKSKPKSEFTKRFVTTDGERLLYAEPVVMKAACVDCHNRHPRSPSKTWKVGDVRGIQTVEVPLNRAGILDDRGIQHIIYFLIIGFIAAISIVRFLIKRNQQEMNATQTALALSEENELRIKGILETAAHTIVTVGANGNIDAVNPAVKASFGYDADALIGHHVSLILPDFGDRLENGGGSFRLDSSSSRELECLGQCEDGTTFPTEVSISAFMRGGQPFYTAIVRDVTVRKAAEAKAREAETRLIEAIEALPDGFVLYDSDDRLVVCNERYRDIYQTSADLIRPGNTFETIIREGARRGQYQSDDVETWIEQRLAEHRNPGAGVEQKLDDGRWLRVIERRTDSGFTVGFRVDITALKEREEALRQSQDLMGATVKAALDAIIVIDHEGNIIRFNPAAERIFGYKADQVIGRDMAELIIPDKYRSAHRNGLAHYLKTQEGPVIGKRIEIEGMRSDGKAIIVELAVQKSNGPDGPVFIGYLRDITDEKAREAALIEAKDKAEVAGRAKAAFLAMMSHEIRTPLNGVLGLLNLLQDTPLKERQREYVRTAHTSGNALLTIINDILDFSKLEAGQMTLEEGIFRVDELLSDVTKIVAPLAQQKGLTVQTSISEPVPEACVGDAGRLRQVLLNLASNAVKFTETGSVSINVNCETPSSEGIAGLTFSVIDTGIGIPDEKKELIFSEFTTLDPGANGQLGGTGLGLAISKAITKTMGGTIEFSSEFGRGSTFSFTVHLPVGDSSLIPRDDEPALPAEHLRDLRVLLAEDNMTNQLVFRTMIEAAGCKVDTASNGLEALASIERQTYDVVLMDVAMPEMDGLEATRQIRQMDVPVCEIPIIALTAYALAEDQARCLAAGMDKVLTKPIVRRKLYAALAEVEVAQDLEVVTPTSPDPIDLSVLDELFEGEPEAIKRQALTQFLADIQEQRDRLDEALNTRDIHVIERASHVLVGLAGTFGAGQVAHIARETNTLARSDEKDDTISSAEALRDACDAVYQFSEGHLANDHERELDLQIA